MQSVTNLFYSGTSGIVVPVPKALYPKEFTDKSRLTYYASLFNSLEINSSFYKTPMISTVSKWAGSVPDNFRFTFKLSKEITHAKELNFNAEHMDNFMKTIDYVGNKKGCVLIQFPPQLKIEKLNEFKNLLAKIREANPGDLWKVAVEFRNKSWYDDEIYDLLGQHKISLVIHDLPASATPIIESTTDFMYLRFHGPDSRYRGSYTDEFLTAYANYIKVWMSKGKTVYFYFNNTMGNAGKNLQTLNSLLQL